MRLAVAIALAISELAVARAQDRDHQHDHHSKEVSTSTRLLIKIRINPEARVSVSLEGELLPRAAPCGRAIELPVKIINEGFVTASLDASLIDSDPESVSLEFPTLRLKGIPQEQHIVRVLLRKPGPFDITITFRAKNDIPDLGGRDRIHLLVRCT